MTYRKVYKSRKKTMKVDYSKGVIYKICCTDPGVKEIYIGSTTSLKHRRHSHKTACNDNTSKEYNLLLYQFIRSTGGWDNWTMVMVEEYPTRSKLELDSRKRYWIEELTARLNKRVPARTVEEYRELSKKSNKDYYYNNLEKMRLKNKIYFKKNHKKINEYLDKNKDKIREQRLIYYNNNKEYNSEKITCMCGATLTRGSLHKHLKTKKHRFYERTLRFIYC